MGAMFDTGIATGKTLNEAFWSLVEQKCYDHGHGGYSGTLAEKSEVQELPVPPGIDPAEYVDLIQRLPEWMDGYYWNDDQKAQHDAWLARLSKFGREQAEKHAQMLDTNKWGPAYAVKVADGKWWVGGLCSS